MIVAAATGFGRLRTAGRRRRRRVALLRRERPETVELLAAARRRGRRSAGSKEIRHRRLEITGDDLVARRAHRGRGRRGPRCDAHGAPAGGSAPAAAKRQLTTNAAATGSTPMRFIGHEIRARFKRVAGGGGAAADLPHGRVLFSTRHGGVRPARREPQPRPAHAGRPGGRDENRRRLAEAVGRGEALPLGRQVHGANVRRATEPPGPARPRTRRGRPGHRPRGRSGARLRRRLLAGRCSPPTARSRRCTAAARPWRTGSSPRACARCARWAGRAGHRPARPGARGCCYEVGEEVHARSPRYDGAARPGQPGSDGRRSRELKAAASTVHDVGLCTMCDPSSSSPPAQRRHDRPPGGSRMARVIAGLDPAESRADRVRERRCERRAGRDPDDVAFLAAVKYVAGRGARGARRGRRHPPGREPRPGARGQGRGVPELHLALHRPAAEPQGQADRARTRS